MSLHRSYPHSRIDVSPSLRGAMVLDARRLGIHHDEQAVRHALHWRDERHRATRLAASAGHWIRVLPNAWIEAPCLCGAARGDRRGHCARESDEGLETQLE